MVQCHIALQKSQTYSQFLKNSWNQIHFEVLERVKFAHLKANSSIFVRTNPGGSDHVAVNRKFNSSSNFITPFFFFYRRYNVDSRSCNISKHVSTQCPTQMTVLTQLWQLPSALECTTLYSALLVPLRLICSESLKQLVMIQHELSLLFCLLYYLVYCEPV